MSEIPEVREIPEDIWETAKSFLHAPISDVHGNSLFFWLDSLAEEKALRVLARAILAERERCEIACQALIDEYVTDERARCANSVWDFYYGEKRGHVTPEEFAEFLQPKP